MRRGFSVLTRQSLHRLSPKSLPASGLRHKSNTTAHRMYQTDTPYTYSLKDSLKLSSESPFSKDTIKSLMKKPKVELKAKGHSYNDDVLTIEWENGTKSEFPSLWLRDHCHCTECLHPSTFQRQVDTMRLSSTLKPLDIQIKDDQLKIVWQEDEKTHETIHPLAFFQTASFNLPQSLSWTKSTMTQLPKVTFEEMKEGPVGMAKALNLLKIYGFVLVEGIETSVEGTQKLGELIGPVRNTLYGGMWDVSPNLAMSDTAYTTDGLNPHTDGCYFTDPPGIQILHIMEFNGKGGLSTLVDGLTVAKQLREQHPEAFKFFSTFPIPFHYLDPSNHLLQKRKVFQLNEEGELVQFSYNNDDRAPFQLPPKEMKAFYSHVQKLLERIRDPENLVEFLLPQGTAMLMDNWRLLHGRTSFSGHRRLGGCYITREDAVSRHLVALKELESLD